MSIVSAAPYRLSMKATSLWAKTGGEERRHLWEPLYIHLADTAETARLLWRRWVPEATKAFIAESLEMAPEDAEMIAVWLAGVHDIGKVIICSLSDRCAHCWVHRSLNEQIISKT